MKKEFEQWAKELQEMILEEDRQIFSPQVIDHYLHPNNLKEISQPHGRATVTGPCGDTMYMGIKAQDGKVADIGFLTDGCGPTVACGSMLTQMALGRTLAQAMAIDQKELLQVLGGLPESHLHCVQLAVDTLHQAIRDCHRSGGELDAQR